MNMNNNNILHITQNTAYNIAYIDAITCDINNIEFIADYFDESKMRFALSYSLDNINWSPMSTDIVVSLAVIDMYKQTSGSSEIFVKFKLIADFTDEHDVYILKDIIINDDVVLEHSKFQITEIQNYRGITNDYSKNLFKPYANLDASIDRMLAQCNKINDIFGHDVYYIKVQEIDESFNNTFKEYAKYKIDSIKSIKVLVPDNDFKTSKLVYSEFAIEYEEDLEIHIVIEAFERAFGINSQPQSRDIVYIPKVGRLYDIVSANNILQLDNIATHNVCALRKHVSMTDTSTNNIDNDTDFDINQAITFEINNFDNNINPTDNSVIDNSPYNKINDDNTQLTDKIISNANVEGANAQALQDYYYLDKHDATRLYTHKLLQITNSALSINSVPIFFRYYNAANILQDIKVIKYKEQTIIANTKSLNLSFWFKLTDASATIAKMHNIVIAYEDNAILIKDDSTNQCHLTISLNDIDLWHFISCNIDLNTNMINAQLFDFSIANNKLSLVSDDFCTLSKILIANKINAVFMYSALLFSNIKIYAKTIDDIVSLAIDKNFGIVNSVLIDTAFDIKK